MLHNNVISPYSLRVTDLATLLEECYENLGPETGKNILKCIPTFSGDTEETFYASEYKEQITFEDFCEVVTESSIISTLGLEILCYLKMKGHYHFSTDSYRHVVSYVAKSYDLFVNANSLSGVGSMNTRHGEDPYIGFSEELRDAISKENCDLDEKEMTTVLQTLWLLNKGVYIGIENNVRYFKFIWNVCRSNKRMSLDKLIESDVLFLPFVRSIYGFPEINASLTKQEDVAL